MSYDLAVPGAAAHQENNSILNILVVAVRTSLKPVFVVKQVVVVHPVRSCGNRSAANRSGCGGKRSGSTMGKAVVLHLVVSIQDQLGCLLRPLTSTSKIHNFSNQMSSVLSGNQVPTFLVAVPSVPYLLCLAMVIAWIISATLSYAEAKRETKKKRYKLFIKRNFDKVQLMAFIGALILLGIHNVRNHRKAWSTNKAQVLYRLRDLLTC